MTTLELNKQIVLLVRGGLEGADTSALSRLREQRIGIGLEPVLGMDEILEAVGQVAESSDLTGLETANLVKTIREHEEQKPMAFIETFVALGEKAVKDNGVIDVKVINSGWGASGFYSKDVLERDMPEAFPPGTHMYWNHPSLSEEDNRPERSLTDLAGVTLSPPRWLEDGPSGGGIYAQARVFSGYKETLDEISEHIGVSILGDGKVRQGEAEGREGLIVDSITRGNSIDFVTRPGAGGEVVTIFESASTTYRRGARESSNGGNDVDELKEVKEDLLEAEGALEQSRKTLKEVTDELAIMREAAILSAAKIAVDSALADSPLPDITKLRLAKTAAANPPVTESGKLDTEALKERVKEVAQEAQNELDAIVGDSGKIRGMGGGGNSDGAPSLEETDKRLSQALKELGLGGKRNGN